VIKDPYTSADTSIREVLDLDRAHTFRRAGGRWQRAGRHRHNRDLRFESRFDSPCRSDDAKDRLVTVKEGAEKDEVIRLLHAHRIEKVLVVDNISPCATDHRQGYPEGHDKPNACKDDQASCASARVGVGAGTDERVCRTGRGGVDVIVVDTGARPFKACSIASPGERTFRKCRSSVATSLRPRPRWRWSKPVPDGVKVGIVRFDLHHAHRRRCRRAQISAVRMSQHTVQERRAADRRGGIRYSGDMARRSRGCVFDHDRQYVRGTEEAPGEVELFQGVPTNPIAAWARSGAMSGQQGSSDRIPGRQHRGEAGARRHRRPCALQRPLGPVIHQLLGGLRSSMGYTGCNTIEEMRTKPKFVRVTSAAWPRACPRCADH